MQSAQPTGDLRRRLIAEGVALAREGGPEAVVLREVARRLGVSAPAAYRHFAAHDHLRREIKNEALGLLDVALNRALARARADGEPAAEQLRRIGLAYVRWARRNPGLFRTAFEHGLDPRRTAAELASPGTVPARRILSQVIGALADAGGLPGRHAAHAEEAAWSAVHGVSVLLISGPLRALPAAEQDAVVARVLTMVVDGL